MSGWFQVNCPLCDAALQVRLSVGNTTVACAECEEQFVAQLQRAHLPAEAASAKRPQRKDPLPAGRSHRASLTAYNIFMKHELPKVRKEQPGRTELGHFLEASSRWHDSPMNPKNLVAGAAPARVGSSGNDESVDDVFMDARETLAGGATEEGVGEGEEERRAAAGGNGSEASSDEDDLANAAAILSGRPRVPARRGRPPTKNDAVLHTAREKLRCAADAAAATAGKGALTASELKQLLLDAGESVTGSKSALVERFIQMRTRAGGS